VIQRADALLKRWIQSVLGAGTVVAALPRGAANPDGPRGIAVELIDIGAAPPPRNTKRPPLVCSLRYLVTAWAETADKAHELLGTLLFAALDDERRTADMPVEADLAPIPPETWLALGAMQRPAFVARLPLSVERPEPAVPRVKVPVLEIVNAATIYGQVVGPGDIPLAGATVVLLSTGQSVSTDGQGRFRFSMVPVRPAKRKLEVRAKGDVQQFETAASDKGGEPMLLRFQIREV